MCQTVIHWEILCNTGMAAYATLFLVAFAAATILPLQSEAVFTGLVLTETYSTLGLLAVASIGNVGGSALNWLLGYWAGSYGQRKWFPVKGEALERARRHYQRFGKWSLLLSWLPIVGDPLTVMAGVMRERFLVFVAIVTIAKVGRYLVLLALAQMWIN
ncbi:MAG: DedA family protein [Hyphomicrobiales bacterium]|nr:DedA family protein [Hyphomicrobiales bacterium]